MANTTITVNVAESQNYLATSKTISVNSVIVLTDITVVPSQNGRLTQTSSYQSPTWNDYNSSQLTIGGTTTAKYCGAYTATFTPKSAYQWSASIQSQYNVGPQEAISVQWVIIGYGVYGIKWTSNVAKGTRTQEAANFADPVPCLNSGSDNFGSSPFDYVYPWCDMKGVVITCSDFEYSTRGMIRIPKFWYKASFNSYGEPNIEISATQKSGYVLSPAHRDRDGNGVRDYVYIDPSPEGLTNVDIAAMRNYVNTEIGEYGYQLDFATYITILLLYIVEMGYTSAADIIGMGRASGSGTWKYHTGTSAASRDTAGSLRYRNIWNLWYYTTPIDGLYYSGNQIYSIDNFKNYRSYNFTNGRLVGDIIPQTSSMLLGLTIPYSGSDNDWIILGNPSGKRGLIYPHGRYFTRKSSDTSVKYCFFQFSEGTHSDCNYGSMFNMETALSTTKGSSSSSYIFQRLFGKRDVFCPPNNYSHISSIVVTE